MVASIRPSHVVAAKRLSAFKVVIIGYQLHFFPLLTEQLVDV